MPIEVETRDLAGIPFRLGEYLVEPSLNRLSRGDTTIQLELKVMDVLVCLAERAGEVVTRQEIVDRVWATEFISDNTLTHAVTELRNALGDDARNPSFIETIHRRGYRLIASVEAAVPDGAGESRVARFPVRERPETATDDRSPYPGLAAFTEEDAEFFFGREDEVARMWRKLTSRRLLAVIGPSGVGKSSFLRAGVIPAKPDGWGVLVCEPGEGPFRALARALLPEFIDDSDAGDLLVGPHDSDSLATLVARWRERHDQALLVVDQFEELFTLNPSDVRMEFSNLMGRLASEVDVHVLLSMRDDFLHQCQPQAALAPIFEDLTPIGQPDGDSLDRALTAPAEAMGFSFDDDQLPQEMVAEVDGERGALPLLAFSVSRLWEIRDREQKRLTRQAYSDIGGVGGALARHAESTLKTIGDERLPIVRELFRNLVTSQGTRAVRSVDDLLSVFPKSERDEASGVLRRLIDARLLTSFEEENVESELARHRVEIVHESLLASWPRLVGWQTQDADAARVRDELRQAARTWDDHDRTTSLLWTGAAYREFRLWHNRYPGGLTQVEDDFATAMIGHAKWRKRRRRITVAVALLLALVVTGVTTVLWRRSVAHGRRAEAQKLIAIGQVQLEDYPTAALAYATRSLEIADSDAARILALEALWMGPTSFTVNDEISYDAQFSPDGQRLVGATRHRLRIVEADGPSSLLDDVHANKVVNFGISPGSEIVCSFDQGGLDESSRLVMWSVLDGRQLAEVKFEEATRLTHFICGDQRALAVVVEDDLRHVDAVYSDGSSERLGTLDILNMTRLDIAVRSGRWIGLAVGEEIFVVEIDENTVSAARSLGRHRGLITSLRVDPDGRFLASADADGRIMIWDPLGQSPPLAIRGPKGGQDFFIRFSDDGALMEAVSIDSEKLGESWVWSVDTDEPRSLRRVKLGLVFDTGGWEWDSPRPRLVKSGPDLKTRLWPVGVPADAEPLELKRGKDGILWEPSFHPDGDWLVTASHNGMAAWPLARPYASIIRRHDQVLYGLVFGPQGDWVASSSMDGTVKLWPLIGEAPAKGRVLHAPPERPQMLDLAVSPSGDRLLVGAGWSGAQLISIEGGEPRIFPGFESQVWGVAFSPDGRLVAAVGGEWEPREKKIRVWDAASGEEVVALGPNENLRPFDLAFIDEDHILSGGNTGLMKWNLETRDHEMVFEDPAFRWAVSADRRRVVAVNQPDVNQIWGWRAVLLDLESGRQTLLETHGNQIRNAALSPTGDIVVTGDSQGIIRVGPATGDEPHLLFGHDQVVEAVAIDPLGRWIASTGEDTTVRLWPMPDLSKPPLHTLPHDELIAKLKTLTNLRVVRDEQSATGWKLTHDPFPGWETVPEW